MISDEDQFWKDPVAFSWEKVTRRSVDPITFLCHVKVAYVPRIEDCNSETRDIAISHPIFTGTEKPSWGGVPNNDCSGDDDNAWKPHKFPSKSLKSPEKKKSPLGSPRHCNGTKSPGKTSKNRIDSKNNASNGAKNSLGDFLSKSKSSDASDLDNQSVSSKSMASRSVSDRSAAERSKAETKLKSKISHRSDASAGMGPIDEQSVSEFSQQRKTSNKGDGSGLGNFLSETSTHNRVADDNRSMMSHSSRSVSVLSTADRSKNENRIRPDRERRVKGSGSRPSEHSPVLTSNKKKASNAVAPPRPILIKSGNRSRNRGTLKFQHDPDILEVPTLSDKEHYRDWEAIWYDDDELAEFRYEAFLEEAGLDPTEYT